MKRALKRDPWQHDSHVWLWRVLRWIRRETNTRPKWKLAIKP